MTFELVQWWIWTWTTSMAATVKIPFIFDMLRSDWFVNYDWHVWNCNFIVSFDWFASFERYPVNNSSILLNYFLCLSVSQASVISIRSIKIRSSKPRIHHKLPQTDSILLIIKLTYFPKFMLCSISNFVHVFFIGK